MQALPDNTGENQMTDKETLEQAAGKEFNLFYSLLRKHGIFEYDARMFPLVKEYANHQSAITRAEVFDEVKTLLTEYYSKAAIEYIINQLKTK